MRLALPLLVVLSIAFAPAPTPRDRGRDRRGDLERLQGEWVVTSTTCEGIVVQLSAPPATIIKGNELTYVVPGGAPSHWTLTLDVGASPRRFVMKRREGRQQEYAGVYAFEGGALKLCSRLGIDGPPVTDFGGGKRVWVEVLQRKKR
jgi:uncharacterized protein (TIGR03067 family)